MNDKYFIGLVDNAIEFNAVNLYFGYNLARVDSWLFKNQFGCLEMAIAIITDFELEFIRNYYHLSYHKYFCSAAFKILLLIRVIFHCLSLYFCFKWCFADCFVIQG